MNDKNYARIEKEISLSGLLWKIVYSWRFLIGCAMIFAIILGGAKYIKDVREVAVSNSQETLSNDDMKAGLSEADRERLEEAENIQIQIDEKENYQKNSILMNLNPYEKHVVVMQYYVDTDYTVNMNSDFKLNYAGNLADAYISYVDKKGMLSELQKTLAWDVDSNYIGELIEAESNLSSNSSDTSMVGAENSSFCVYTYGTTEKMANEIADALEPLIEDYQSKLSQNIGLHKLVLVDRYASIVTDNSLASSQICVDNDISTLQSKLDSLTATFSQVQLQLLHGDKAETDVQTINANISKKYVLLGIIAGIFLGCLWISVRYVISPRLRSVQELQNSYGLRIFGEITNQKSQKKRMLKFVDRGLDKIRHKEVWTLDEQKELILTNLCVTCKRENIQTLFVTTSLHMNEQDKQLVDTLIGNLNSFGIQITYGENITRNAASLEKMSSLSDVVIVEKEEETEYASLEKELTLCNEQKAKVLGMIVLN